MKNKKSLITKSVLAQYLSFRINLKHIFMSDITNLINSQTSTRLLYKSQ